MKKYNDCSKFKERFAIAELNNKYGFINDKGKEITEIKYDESYDFNDGFVMVKLDNEYKFIDTKGKEIECIKDIITNIGSRDATLSIYHDIDNSIVYFETGCFLGNLNDFKQDVEKTHNNKDNKKYYDQYMEVINKYE